MLRTFRVNFRKNWVCQPSKWNLFFENLEADLNDLNDEIEAQIFDLSGFVSADEDIIQKAGKDGRTQYPQL